MRSRAIHLAYLEAGADIIETNTFNSTRISQADYGMEALVAELNFESARLCRAKRRTRRSKRTDAAVSSPARWGRPIAPPRSRPTSTILAFARSASTICARPMPKRRRRLLEGGADILIVETIFDTLNAKAALVAIESVRGARRASCR